MSALTATTAVLYQIRKLNDDREAALRSLELIDRNTPKNHQWTTISRRISALRTWKAMTAVAPCPDWPGKPPTWRWDEVDVKDDISAQPAISQNGRWMVCTALNVHLWREYDQEAGKWDDWRKFTGAGDILNKRISAGPRTPSDPAGTAQVVAITADGELLHCISTNGFDEWGTAITGVGPEAAIAVAPSGSAHVITLRATDSALLYAIRATDGIWTSFLGPPGPPGLPNMKADQLAVAAAPDDDFVMVVVIDKQGTVQAIGRNPNGTWTAWQAARPPADGLKARLVSVACVSRSSWNARVVAKFSDGDLYYSLLDVVGNREQYPWIPLPYPATAEYDTSCLTMGASVDICDPPGSASVWITSQPKRPTGQEKEQGS
jgi:hypothetical protein